MRRILPMLALVAVGCGGSNTGTGSSTGGAVAPTNEIGTAKFIVDVKTGAVSVVPLSPGSQSPKMKSMAAFGGSAIGLTSSLFLADVTGNGRYSLHVTAQNRISENIGSADQGYRVVFSNFTNLTGPLADARTLVSVTTMAGSGTAGTTDGASWSATMSPSSVARMPDGSVAFVDYGAGKIRILRKGNVSTLNAAIPTGAPSSVASDGSSNYAYVGCLDDLYRVDVNTLATLSFTGTGNAQKRVNATAFKSSSLPTTVAVVKADGTLATAQLTSGGVGLFSTVMSQLSGPSGVAFFGDSGIVVSELGNNRLKYINLTTGASCAIGSTTSGMANGSGDFARFSAPQGLVNINGSLYVIDTNNHLVRQVVLLSGADPAQPSSWYVSTIAGAVPPASGFADGGGNVAKFFSPTGIAADGSGNLVIADYLNYRIRRITPIGAGFPVGYLSYYGTATSEPVKIANADGYFGSSLTAQPYYDQTTPLNVGITSSLKDWQFIVPEGVSAFQFTVTFIGRTQSLASLGGYLNPGTTGVGSPDVLVSTYTGSTGPGALDGKLAEAQYRLLHSGSVDQYGDLYVSDYGNGTIRRIDRDGTVNSIAGVSGLGGFINGSGAVASFLGPTGVCANADGSVVFVCDSGNNALRMMVLLPDVNARSTGSGQSTYAKNPVNWAVYTIAGGVSSATALNGRGDQVNFSSPSGICLTSTGDILLTESTGNRVKRIHFQGGNAGLASNYYVTTVAGDQSAALGLSGSADGTGASARFSNPNGIAISPSGDVYVADTGNNMIRRVNGDVVSKAAGQLTAGFSDATLGTLAKFNQPYGICVDSSGTVYVSEFGQGFIRKFNDPYVKTVAGNSAQTKPVDGPGNVAGLGRMRGLALDPLGTLYVLEDTRIRMINRLIDTGNP